MHKQANKQLTGGIKYYLLLDVYVLFQAPVKGHTKNYNLILIMCPPPRKSLVKGERFIRSEGRPE